MTIKELKKLINKYDDNLEISFAKLSNHDDYKLYNPLEFIEDKNDLIVLITPSCRVIHEDELSSKTKIVLCYKCGKEVETPIHCYTYNICNECVTKEKNK